MRVLEDLENVLTGTELKFEFAETSMGEGVLTDKSCSMSGTESMRCFDAVSNSRGK
jgi:hypothetical protein